MKIPDISHYNKVTNWNDVKLNCDFVIAKATQGVSFIDNTLDNNIKNFEKLKIPYYLYAYLNKGDETLQAKFLVKTCKNKVGKYFRGYVLDVEEQNKASNVKNALAYISKQSNKCMLYTMYAQYSLYKDIIAERPSNCAWWEARYGKNDGYYSSDYKCHSGADLHQFTSKGKCSGITSPVDLSIIVSEKKKLSWFTNETIHQSLQNESNEKTNQGTEIAYYPKYTGKSKRIDTVLKSIGVPVSYRGTYLKRRPIARKNGYSGNSYIGTAKQNIHLIDLACKGKLVK